MRNFKNQLVLIPLLIFLLSITSHGQTSILPTNDAYTSEANPNQNFGGESNLRISKSINGNEEHAFLSFNLDVVTGDFEQIILKITSPNNSQISTQLRLLSSDVNESSITWNNQPTDNDFIVHGGSTFENVIYYDVTQIASERIDQNETLNFLLYSNLIGDSSQIIASKESASNQDKPQLILLENTTMDFSIFGLKNVTGTSIEEGDEGDFSSIIMDSKNNFEDTLDKYGGFIQPEISYEATGYFRTERINGIWNFIDPLGNIFYSVGLNSVDDTDMLTLPQDFTDLGINTLGSWSEETIDNIAYTPNLNVLRKYQNTVDGDAELSWDAGVLPVWEEDFESYVNEVMPDELQPYKDDPYLLGYFLDNELKFSSTQLEKSLEFAPTNDQFIKANEYMAQTYGANYSPNQVTDEDELIYVEMVADKYFSVITSAVRNVDPNHLILGTRLNGNVRYRVPVVEKTGEYCDVMSINYYREWEIQEQDWMFWSEHTDIPWITTEFYTKGLDTVGSLDVDGNIIDNDDGAGWLVPDQEERALFFENYVIKTLEDPNCIGYHWFRFIDNNASNKGLYNSDYEAYPPLAESFEQINRSKYALRENRLRGFSTSILENVITLSVNDELVSPNTIINSYPNPAIDILNIANFGQSENYTSSLYDLKGRLIKESTNQKILVIGDMSPGIYLLEITDQQSGAKFAEKIAIKR